MRNIKNVAVLFVGLMLLSFGSGYFLGGYKARKDIGSEQLPAGKYKVVRTPGGMLEVSTLIKQETVARKIVWDCPLKLCDSLPEANSQISVEAHYAYRVPLAEYWVLEKIRDQPLRYRLKVPKLEPKLPVAVDLSTIREEIEEEIFSPPAPDLKKMQTYLGQELAGKAIAPAYIEAQSDVAEKTVEEFARKWMSADGERISSNAKIEVVFSN